MGASGRERTAVDGEVAAINENAAAIKTCANGGKGAAVDNDTFGIKSVFAPPSSIVGAVDDAAVEGEGARIDVDGMIIDISRIVLLTVRVPLPPLWA